MILVRLDHLVNLDHPEHKVSPDRQETPETLDQREHQEMQAHLAHLVSKEFQVIEEPLVPLDLRVPQVMWGPKETLEGLDQQATLVNLAHWVQLVPPANLEILEMPDLREQLDHREQLGRLEKLEHKDRKVKLEVLDLKEIQDQQDPKEVKDL